MSGASGGCGRGRNFRSGVGRTATQPTSQNDPIENNETNTFCGMFGGILDSTQPFGNILVASTSNHTCSHLF